MIFKPYHVKILTNLRSFLRELIHSLRSQGRSRKRRGKRRGMSGAFTRSGIQRKIGVSALRFAENGSRRRMRGRRRKRKKVLIQANFEGVLFRPERTAYTRLILVIVLYLDYLTLRNFFSCEQIRAFFLRQRVYPFSIPFFYRNL